MTLVFYRYEWQAIYSTAVRFDADLQTKMRSNRHGPSHCSQNEFPVMAKHSDPFATLRPPLADIVRFDVDLQTKMRSIVMTVRIVNATYHITTTHKTNFLR
jgi:hypothetical protein